MLKTYLVFTTTYGILRKADDSISAARQWAARAFPNGEIASVIREHKSTTGATFAELESDWRQTVAERRPC